MDPKNITPEILAGDIRRYLSEGVSLEDIHQGALQNGISEDLWQQAIALNEPEKPAKTRKKKRVVISAFIIVFILIFSGIFLTNNTNDSKFEGEFNVPEPVEQIVEEKKYSDADFQAKIDAGEIEIVKEYDTPQVLSTLSDVLTLVKEASPKYAGIKKIFLEFNDMGIIKRNMVVYWDEQSAQKTFVRNTKYPYEISESLLYKDTTSTDVPSQMLLSTSWEELFEKVGFMTFAKEDLTFDIEIYSDQEKKYVRVTALYPDTDMSSSIEIEFYEYENVLKETKVAFGKRPKISTGKFAEKYPVRRGPVPSSSE